MYFYAPQPALKGQTTVGGELKNKLNNMNIVLYLVPVGSACAGGGGCLPVWLLPPARLLGM
jgi:hypothetical protein